MGTDDALDARVTALARSMAGLAGERTKLVQSSWWSERMLEWAMSHPSFRTELFRFVDVFPATTDDADVLAHLDDYFEGPDVPGVLDLGLGIADHLPFGSAAAAGLARRNISRVAEQFIIGTDPAGAGRRPGAPVATRECLHRRPAGGEDDHRERGRRLRGPSQRSVVHSRRGHRPMAVRPPARE
ncbi:MAG: hypothetical protein M3011_12415 [Actinomycetota bacterium]|nr:hypothetical protein [Actinomycetota bacterium]